MKILQVISSIDPTGGGPIECVRQLSATMALSGHTIEVASLDDPQLPYVREFPFPVHTLGPGVGLYSFTRRFPAWMKENAHFYDAVIVNGIWQYHSFGTWKALRNSSTPYVVFSHGMLDPWFKTRYPLKHLKKCLYWPWAEYRVLRDAAAVLFTCEDERILARQSFAPWQCNEVVVNFGTTAPLGDSTKQHLAFVSKFPHLRQKRLALSIGRIHHKKGCDLLIDAFAKVLAVDSAWHLVMAGPDQIGWRSQLEHIAKQQGITDRITWTGMLEGDLKWGAFHAAEVFVLPSHSENFGIVVAEALACGTPVLISNKVNIWREVVEDNAGLVAPDTAAGTEALLSHWTNLSPGSQEQMRANAKACFLQRFEIHGAASSLVEVLAGLRTENSLEKEECPYIQK